MYLTAMHRYSQLILVIQTTRCYDDSGIRSSSGINEDDR